MEPGETLETAARWETLEETGLRVDEISLFGVFSGPEYYYRYPNGDEVYNVAVVFSAQEASGEIMLDPAEHTDWDYFEVSALPGELSPPILPFIEQYIHRQTQGAVGDSASLP
jgi:8-oxo-dGTP pyrophosphatase MutT (NUDIX family)